MLRLRRIRSMDHVVRSACKNWKVALCRTSCWTCQDVATAKFNQPLFNLAFGLFSALCNCDRTFTRSAKMWHDLVLQLRRQSLSSQSFRSCGYWKTPHFWKRPKPCGVARLQNSLTSMVSVSIDHYIIHRQYITCFHIHPWESSASFCTLTCWYDALALTCPTKAKVHACWQLLSRPHHCREADLRDVTPLRHQWKGFFNYFYGTWNLHGIWFST